MLIDLVGLTMACFPGLSRMTESEKFLGGFVFDTLSAGIKMDVKQDNYFL
jgi:hypothetical protein